MKTCLVETRGVTQIPKAGMIQDNGLPDPAQNPSRGKWSSYHALGVRGRLRFDRSLPKRDYLSLWRKGSQVKL